VPAAAALVGLLLTVTPLGNTTARWLHDTQLKLLAPTTRSADVLVFDIDDDSLAALKPLFGTWPFKRDVYALAIEQLREAGARAVALDLLLADSGPADAALARAIARPGAPVLLAAAGLRGMLHLAFERRFCAMPATKRRPAQNRRSKARCSIPRPNTGPRWPCLPRASGPKAEHRWWV
jgi:CHASE2 domain-containing sensor protein